MPSYTDPAAKSEWDKKSQEAFGREGIESFKHKYYEGVAALRTNRTDFMDLGLGFGSLSLRLLAGSLALRVRRLKDVAAIHSPRRTWKLFAMGNVFWLAMIPAGFIVYTFRFERGDYPWFADSIGIGIIGQACVAVVGLPLMNVFFLAFATRGKHPAPIFALRPRFDLETVCFEFLLGVLAVLNVRIIVGDVITGDFAALPTSVVFFDLLLATRAGLVHRQKLEAAAKAGETPA